MVDLCVCCMRNLCYTLQAYATLLKTNLDGLKKRDKKTAKAAAAKAKKSKATV